MKKEMRSSRNESGVGFDDQGWPLACPTVNLAYRSRTYLRKSVSWNVGRAAGYGSDSVSGKVLAGPYKGSMLASLAQDIQHETSAIQSMHTLTAAEPAYSGTYPSGFTDSLDKFGPAAGAPDQDHAGLIDIALATGSKDGYQFGITIPAGTSTGGKLQLLSCRNRIRPRRPSPAPTHRGLFVTQNKDGLHDLVASSVTTGSPRRTGIRASFALFFFCTASASMDKVRRCGGCFMPTRLSFRPHRLFRFLSGSSARSPPGRLRLQSGPTLPEARSPPRKSSPSPKSKVSSRMECRMQP